jgi:hypothetical protein
MNGQKSDFAERRAGKVVNASIRIGVTDEGIYRVTYSNLANAGVAVSNLVGSTMRLFCRTQEVAILVSNTNQWTASDYFLFPGVGYDGYYSMTNVYWLGFGSGGKRMATRSANPINGLSPVTSYRKTAIHHVDSYYSDTYRPDDESIDHWADLPGIAYSSPVTFSMVTDRVVTNDASRLQAVMLGWTSDDSLNPDHTTSIGINSTIIGQFPYDGQVTAQLSTNFISTLLQTTNSVSFLQTINVNDQVLLERFSITYSRSLYQDSGALIFDGRPGTNNFLVTGFTASNNLMALDITDPANAIVLTGAQPTDMGGGLYAEQFGDMSASTSRYSVVSTATGLKDVGFIQRTFFRNLAITNQQADYLVICPYSFRQQVYRLLALRYSQGLSVAVVPLPDLYNEFSYGITDAAAIKQFIGYAFHHWKSPPKYILLAWNGTYDPRHNEADSTVLDLVPVHLGPGYSLWTSLDGWYVAVSGSDNVPDIALGRIPVQTTSQFKTVIDKIISFENVSSNDGVRAWALMAADEEDGDMDFRGASEVVRMNDLPAFPFQTSACYQDDGVTYNTAFIIDEINSGQFLVNYFGHGSVLDWASSPTLFSVVNISSLNNTNYPIISMLTCENGAFQGTIAANRCMADAFLESTHGASACLAASGLSTLIGSENLSHGFYGAMFRDRKKRIGDTLLPAYSALYLGNGNTRELLFFELFGDPAMIINP